MPLNAPRRGRPKGSGIDDKKVLRDIAAMIAAKPEMKPTTAIRALGVTDPSAIRRLRDKFHQLSADMASSTACPGSQTGGAAAVNPARTPHPPVRVVAAEVMGGADTRKELPIARAARSLSTATDSGGEAQLRTHLSTTGMPSALDVFALWCGIGINAMSTAFAAHAEMTRNLARLPHIDLVLRQQLAINELAMSFVPQRAIDRPTLH